MTIEEYQNMSADELEKMTDLELSNHLKGYFCITRPTPELKAANSKAAAKSSSAKTKMTNIGGVKVTKEQMEEIAKAKAIAEQMGFGDILKGII